MHRADFIMSAGNFRRGIFLADDVHARLEPLDDICRLRPGIEDILVPSRLSLERPRQPIGSEARISGARDGTSDSFAASNLATKT